MDAETAFNYESQLWRLEVYRDRRGRTICKGAVRFVRRRTGRNVGEVTPELAEKNTANPRTRARAGAWLLQLPVRSMTVTVLD